MAKIKADVAALLANKAEIDKKASELQSLNSNLNALLSDIEGSWDGEASDRYIDKMREHKKKAEQMVEVLQEFSSYIQEAATRFEQRDRESAAKIKGC